MKMIVGLGNPGKQYEQTRHNVGFMTVDKYVKDNNLDFKLDKTMQAEICVTNIRGEKVIFVKPFTYMNDSGRSVQAIKSYYKIAEEDILVIYDDLDLESGKVRLRQKGSSGGHNGIKSIINTAKCKDFKRIKIGIGRPMQGKTVIDHVLGKFSKDEMEKINTAISKSERVIDDYISGNSFEKLMTNYN